MSRLNLCVTGLFVSRDSEVKAGFNFYNLKIMKVLSNQMKTSNLFSTLLCLLVLVSCSTPMKMLSNGKQIDPRLAGVWTGSEVGQQIEGVEKSWEMIRSEDGTFILKFQFREEGKWESASETGNWWIEGGKFHEFHDASGKTDIYRYKVLSKDQIKFNSKALAMSMNKRKYEFIDTRKPDTL